MATYKKYFWKKLENGLLSEFDKFYDYKDRPESLNSPSPDDYRASSIFAGFNTEREAVLRLEEIKKEYFTDELLAAVLVQQYILP